MNPLVDGELISVNFKEGEQVQAGQVLATIDPRPYRKFNWHKTKDNSRRIERRKSTHRIKTDLANVEHAKLLLTYTQVTAPVTGVTGLRKVDPVMWSHPNDNGEGSVRQ